MSNNKQSSVEKMFQEMLGIQQEGIKLTFDQNLALLEKYKAMHKEEIEEAWDKGDYCIDLPDGTWEQKYKSAEQYYSETFKEPAMEKVTHELKQLRKLAALLQSAWYHGDWKAETANEREMEDIMKEQGLWPITLSAFTMEPNNLKLTNNDISRK